ncbi:hypothetical protein [Frateuria defendens]|uniref:hypothetical protein n=1 Tax=Frateuria defendens TaxID=2219559 RepID=UPI00066FE355|nr:hypothetical protein [Frateuria defendens]
MRVIVAALIGGIVMFIWGALAHTVLGLGETGLRAPADEDKVLSVLREGLGGEAGVYVLPWLGPEGMHDEAKVKAYGAKAEASPYAFVVYSPQGRDMTKMGPQLFHQWLSDTLAALALAFVLALSAFGFRRRLAISAAAAVFAWLSLLVPYWTWYRFPGNFTVAALVEELVGWLLAGAAMAWWLGRSERLRAV